MPFKRILLLIGVVFALTGAALVGGRKFVRSEPPYYNCLWLNNGMRVQLNTHLATPLHVISNSPDGTHRLLRWDHPHASRLVVEDRRSGAWHAISDPYVQSDHVQYGDVIWSPDNASIVYKVRVYDNVSRETEYFTHLANIHTGQLALLPSHSATFSPTSDYLLLSGGDETIISTHTLTPAAVDFSPERSVYYFAWSPTGNRLAFVTTHPRALYIYDLDQQRMGQISLADIGHLPQWQSWSGRIDWSPDGMHLTVNEYMFISANQPNPVFSYIFAAPDTTLTLHAQFESLWMSGLSRLNYQYTIIANAREAVYFHAPLPTDTSQNTAAADISFELWRFDLVTQTHELLVSDLHAVDFNGEQFALLRGEGDTLLLEIRNRDGRQPIAVRTFPADRARRCRWDETPVDAQILTCATQINRDVWLFDAQGRTIWPPEGVDHTDTRFHGNPDTHIWYTPDGRFILLPVHIADGIRQLDLVDLHTYQTYTLPDVIQGSRYGLFRDTLLPAGSFDMRPWPDDDSQWQVVLEDIVYRFDPAANTWEPTPYTYSDIWSPDGKRVASMQKSAIPYAVDLFAQDADGSRQWYLGSFPRGTIYAVQWTQCGDVFAPLRDHLAAETP